MKLKYVGPDRVYGLEHGQFYNIELFAKNSHIWVRVEGREAAIPYSTPLAFSNNWTTGY